MIIRRSTAIRDARAAVHLNALSGGAMHLYTGPMPDGGEAITDQTLLAIWSLPSPAGAVDAGVFAAASGLEAMVLADGVPAWVRLLDGAGAWVMDMDAGGVGSGVAVIVSPAQLYAGGTARIERLRLIEP